MYQDKGNDSGMDTQRLEQLWRQVRGNSARLGVVASVLVLGLLLWGRLILLERVPRIATADPDATQQPKTAAEDVTDPTESTEGLTDPHNRTGVNDYLPPVLQTPPLDADVRQGRDN